MRCSNSFGLFETNMSDNLQLSDKNLTHKLTVLMTLPSVSRASSLQHLNIKFVARNYMSYKFYIHKLHKTWRRGKAPSTSHIRHTNKILTFLLLRHLMNIFLAQKVRDLGRSVLNFY